MNLISYKKQDILAKNKISKLQKIEHKKSLKDDNLVFVGAGKPIGPFSEDWPGVINYSNRINRYVQSLYHDQRNQIVYQDYKQLENVSGNYGTGVLASISLLKDRTNSRGVSQTSKDLEWDNVFNPFYIEWTNFNDDVHSYSPGVSPESAWEKLQNFELRLRDLQKSFSTLGNTKLTDDLSKTETLESPTGKKEDIAGIPTWVYWAGGAALVLFLVVTFAPTINALAIMKTK